jgi:hypothetical protein
VRYNENARVRWVNDEIQDEIQYEVTVLHNDGGWQGVENVTVDRVHRVRATENIFVPLYLERELREQFGIELRPIVEAYQRQEAERREAGAQREPQGRTFTFTIRATTGDGEWRDYEPLRIVGNNAYFGLGHNTAPARIYGTGLDWQERQRQLTEADQRAEALLCSHLTPDQVRTWQSQNYFDVPMRAGRYHDIYRIRKWDTVLRRRDGHVIASYCIQAEGEDVAPADLALAQKLLLETDPATFHRIANVISRDYINPLPCPVPKGQESVIESEPEHRIETPISEAIGTFGDFIQRAYAVINELDTAMTAIITEGDDVRKRRLAEAVELDRSYSDWLARRLREDVSETLYTRPANDIATDRARSPPAPLTHYRRTGRLDNSL